MQDAFGRICSYLFGILLMVIVPVIIISVKMENTIQAYINSEAVQFVDTGRSLGYISADNYEQFLTKVGGSGVYLINIEHRSSLAYPVINDAGDGGYRMGYDVNDTKEILMKMYDNTDEIYPMKDGDLFKVTVRSQKPVYSGVFSRIITGSTTGGITVSYGGMVGNSLG